MSRFLKRLLVLLIIFAAAFSIGLHLYLKKEGTRIVRSQLKRMFHHSVKIGSISSAFPFDLIIDNLEVEGVCKVRRAIVSGGVLDIFSGNIVLSELTLINAEINVGKTAKKPAQETEKPESEAAKQNVASSIPPQPKETSFKVPASAAVTEASGNLSAEEDSSSVPYFFVKKLIIADSSVNFSAPGKDENGVKMTIKMINGLARNIQFPAVNRVITTFNVAGSIPWMNLKEEGKVELTGWMNLVDKDMLADLKMRDVDALFFYPYYRDWLDMQKANVGKAKVNFQSHITGLKNDVTMDCRLELAELQFKERKEGEAECKEEKIASAVFNILQACNKGGIVLDFKMRTQMDSPEFAFGAIRSAFETKVTQAVQQESNRFSLLKTPARVVGGTLKSAADLTRSLIGGTVGFGSEIASAFKHAFQKQK
jgi:hypothetical protein